MATLPKMIELVRSELDHGTFESSVKPHFVELVRSLIRVLRPGGLVVIHHYMFQLDLDWGYPPDLWENIVPITRGWLSDIEECREEHHEGFDLRWWIFLRKA